MRLVRQLLLIGALSLFVSVGASAVPEAVVFYIESIDVENATLNGNPIPTAITVVGGNAGTGTIDLATGMASFALGSNSDPVNSFDTLINLFFADQAVVTSTGWGQNSLLFNPLAVGATEINNLLPLPLGGSVGTSSCSVIGATLGPLICGGLPPVNSPWGNFDLGDGTTQTSEINVTAGTITVFQTAPDQVTPAGTANFGERTTVYRFMPVPEPTTALLMGLGFLGLGFAGRSRRA